MSDIRSEFEQGSDVSAMNNAFTIAAARNTTNVNENAIQDLRDAADWLEQHPELPRVYMNDIALFVTWGDCDQKKDIAIVARAIGQTEKSYTDSSIILRKKFGQSGANIAWCGDRDKVCSRVQVGTRVVPAAEEVVIPAKPEHEEPVYEWRCGSVLAPADKAQLWQNDATGVL